MSLRLMDALAYALVGLVALVNAGIGGYCLATGQTLPNAPWVIPAIVVMALVIALGCLWALVARLERVSR